MISVRMMKAAFSGLMLAGIAAMAQAVPGPSAPEPGTYAMLGSGVAVAGGFLLMRYRANKK